MKVVNEIKHEGGEKRSRCVEKTPQSNASNARDRSNPMHRLYVEKQHSTAEKQARNAMQDIYSGKKPRSITATPGNEPASRNAESVGSHHPAPRPVIEELEKKGRPLPRNVQQSLNSIIGEPIGNIRIHSGSSAARAAESIDAEGYTHRNHVVLRSADPETVLEECIHAVQHEKAGKTEVINRSPLKRSVRMVRSNLFRVISSQRFLRQVQRLHSRPKVGPPPSGNQQQKPFSTQQMMSVPNRPDQKKQLLSDTHNISLIEKYTSLLFNYVNNYLRHGKYEIPIDPEVQELVQILDKLPVDGVENVWEKVAILLERELEQLPDGNAQEVLRVLHLHHFESDVFTPGNVITERGFTSTSTDLKSILGIKSTQNTLMVINVPSNNRGKDISKFSIQKHEKEVLFPRNTKFEVKEIVKKGDSNFEKYRDALMLKYDIQIPDKIPPGFFERVIRCLFPNRYTSILYSEYNQMESLENIIYLDIKE